MKKIFTILSLLTFLTLTQTPIFIIATTQAQAEAVGHPRFEEQVNKRNCIHNGEGDKKYYDDDCDGIPNETDNCPQIFNTNQIDTNNNGKGNVCDFTWQKTFRQHIENSLQTPTTQERQDLSGCVMDPTNAAPSDIQCTAPDQNLSKKEQEKWNNLANAFRNKQIVSVLEEPISNENIFNRAQICDTKLARDINGFLIYTNQHPPEQPAPIDFDKLASLTTKREVKAGKVAISIDSCYTAYVQTCTPQNTYVRETTIPGSNGTSTTLPRIITCSQVQLIFADSGADLIKQYVGLIYRWATGIVGVFCVLVIVINGIMISVAQGDDGKVTEAKNRIFQSLTAMAILFFAGIILYTINPNYFTTSDLKTTTEEPAPAEAENGSA